MPTGYDSDDQILQFTPLPNEFSDVMPHDFTFTPSPSGTSFSRTPSPSGTSFSRTPTPSSSASFSRTPTPSSTSFSRTPPLFNRFTNMDRRLTDIDTRLTDMDERISELDERFDEIDNVTLDITGLRKRVSTIEHIYQHFISTVYFIVMLISLLLVVGFTVSYNKQFSVTTVTDSDDFCINTDYVTQE